MGLSLSVLVALCFLLPGMASVLGYSRLHSPDSPPTALDSHLSFGLIIALASALVLHATWFVGIEAITLLAGWPTPSVSQFVALLSGSPDQNPEFGKALESLQRYPMRITGYFLTIGVIAWHLGRMLNRRMRPNASASWYDLLHPNDPDFVWLTLDVHLDGTCFLFAGIARQISVDKTGTLERVVLANALKRPLHPDANAKRATPSDRWVEIPGEFVVVQAKDITTVNVDYLYLEDAA